MTCSVHRVLDQCRKLELPPPYGFTGHGSCVGYNIGGGSFGPTEQNGPWEVITIEVEGSMWDCYYVV